ncbi:MAG: serpin family protein [Myxococcales bacterium]|nr:serpin family protein [Myxococcales bacterium]
MKTWTSPCTAWLSAFCVAAASCAGGQSGEPLHERFEELTSALSRDDSPDVDAASAGQLRDSNRRAALAMYGELANASDENLFFSPHSISTALVMTYAGAAGTTAEAMVSALHFDLPDETLHASFNQLDLELESRGEQAQGDDEPFRLHVVNSIWGQRGTAFRASFIDTLGLHYGAGLKLLDFQGATDESRDIINAWVEHETDKRVIGLLPDGALSRQTLMVLVNAIHFEAGWVQPFDEASTEQGDFTTLAGEMVQVPMMHGTVQVGYYEAPTVTAVDVGYQGRQLSMLLLVPNAGTLPEFEAQLSVEGLAELEAGLRSITADLGMPRWKHEGESIRLKAMLSALGMAEAFDSSAADFSNAVDDARPYIDDVFHQATIRVDEEGTEASAATAVVLVGRSAPPQPELAIAIDRPFLYLIRDEPTGAILFMGRMAKP